MILFGKDTSPPAPTELDETLDTQIYILTPPDLYDMEEGVDNVSDIAQEELLESDEFFSKEVMDGVGTPPFEPVDAVMAETPVGTSPHEPVDAETAVGTPPNEPNADTAVGTPPHEPDAETAVGTPPREAAVDAEMDEDDMGTPLHVKSGDADMDSQPAVESPDGPDVSTPKSPDGKQPTPCVQKNKARPKATATAPKAKSKATSKAKSKPKSKPKKRKAKSLVESTPGTREDGEPHDNSNGKPSTQKQTRREKDEIEKKLHSVSCLYFFCNLELGQNQLLTHRQPCRYGFWKETLLGFLFVFFWQPTAWSKTVQLLTRCQPCRFGFQFAVLRYTPVLGLLQKH